MDFDDNTEDDTFRGESIGRLEGQELMFSRRAAFLLATLVFLGGRTLVHGQAAFGKPVAVDGADEFGLRPPSRSEIFRVQSEQSLKEQLRQELPTVKKVAFPKDASLPDVPTEIVPFPERVVSPIAGRVCYRPLYFEAKRTERFGDYVPCVQPLLSAGRFYGDVVILPCRLLLTPPWTFECDNR